MPTYCDGAFYVNQQQPAARGGFRAQRGLLPIEGGMLLRWQKRMELDASKDNRNY